MPRKPGAVNLCFHGIGTPGRPLEPGEDVYWVGVERFEQLLDEAARHPNVRISFDDGNASDVEIALPRLRRRQLTATFFLLAGRIDTPGSVTSAGVSELRAAGMPIGSHGWSHRSWRGMDAEASHQELVLSAEVLSDLARMRVREAACPRGEYDRGALQQLRKAGYERVFTSDRRRARDRAWLQPRFSLHHDDDVDGLRSAVDAGGPSLVGAARAAYHLVKRWR